MKCIAKPFSHHVEVVFKSGRKQILVITVPAYLNIVFCDLVEYGFHIRKLLGYLPMYLHPYHLAIILCKFPHLVQRGGYLCNGFFARNFRRHVIRFNLQPGCTYIPAQYNIFFGLVDIPAELFRLGAVKFKIRAVTYTYY